MKIAIITGGETGERVISIRSAKNVKDLLDFAETTTFTFPEDVMMFIKSADEFDLAVPVIHGLGGEDGSVQGLLKNIGLPFIFSDISAHAIAIDKKFTKEIATSLGITSPRNTNSFPLFAKPRNGGSSLSSKFCEKEEDLNNLLKADPKTEFICEEPIKGREFTVGVFDKGADTIALPVAEVIPKGQFFDFENKYDPEKLAAEICPAEIDISFSNELQRQAMLIHKHLGVRHLSRSDFIVTPDNKIYFLEINTIPGMTDTSLIPKMFKTANISLREIFKVWCEIV